MPEASMLGTCLCTCLVIAVVSSSMAEPADSPTPGRTTVPETKPRGISGFVHLLGPGLITGASDDDPSGIGTYSQVGSQFGYGLLWLALFTFPLMSSVGELCARVALYTGAGLGASWRRSVLWCVFSLAKSW